MYLECDLLSLSPQGTITEEEDSASGQLLIAAKPLEPAAMPRSCTASGDVLGRRQARR